MSINFHYFIPLLCIILTAYSFERARPASPADDIQLIPFPDYRSPSPSPEPESQFDTPVNLKKLSDTAEQPEPFKTFWDWKKACNESLAKENSPLTKELFLREMSFFIKDFQKSGPLDSSFWVQPRDNSACVPNEEFFTHNLFEPYAIKLETDPEEKTAFIGDIHGDIQSFNQFIEALVDKGITNPEDPFIVNPKSAVILLGDYTDRGKWGVEVLYALSRFVRKNISDKPGEQKVFALRGNHEDPNINAYSPPRVHNLYMELKSKFNDTDVIDTIERMYNCLPLALFLRSGSNALACCHGGIEPGFADSQTLLNAPGRMRLVLINTLYREDLLKKLGQEYQPALRNLIRNNQLKNFDPRTNFGEGYGYLHQYQFLWGDYDFESDSDPATPIAFQRGRGMRLTQQITRAWLDANSSISCKLIGNIRGHQHSNETMGRILNQDGKSSPEEAGMAKIWLAPDQQQPAQKVWPGIVCTLCACPHTGYGEHHKYNFGAYCILKTAHDLGNWNLKVHQFGQTP